MEQYVGEIRGHLSSVTHQNPTIFLYALLLNLIPYVIIGGTLWAMAAIYMRHKNIVHFLIIGHKKNRTYQRKGSYKTEDINSQHFIQ
jgi:hypothetical protein